MTAVRTRRRVTSITGVNGETGATVGTVDVSNTTHTNAGTYAGDSWSFTGTANYNNIGNTTITDQIDKANATVVVTPYSVTYDAQSAHGDLYDHRRDGRDTAAAGGSVDVSGTTHTGRRHLHRRPLELHRRRPTTTTRTARSMTTSTRPTRRSRSRRTT